MAQIFIALEGIDGSGTTTQLPLLQQHFEQQGYRVLTTAEPTNNVLGQQIRASLQHRWPCTPETLALLFAADRLDHVHKDITPALERGDIVICDRYVLSSLAYQGLACELDWLLQINKHARHPDLSIIFDLPASTASQRRQQRAAPAEHFEVDATQKQLAARYNHLASALPATAIGPIARIDASQAVADVTQHILALLQPLLPATNP